MCAIRILSRPYAKEGLTVTRTPLLGGPVAQRPARRTDRGHREGEPRESIDEASAALRAKRPAGAHPDEIAAMLGAIPDMREGKRTTARGRSRDLGIAGAVFGRQSATGYRFVEVVELS
jgi:hypothetical protein